MIINKINYGGYLPKPPLSLHNFEKHDKICTKNEKNAM